MKTWNTLRFNYLICVMSYILAAIFWYASRDIISPANIYPRMILIGISFLATLLLITTIYKQKRHTDEISETTKPLAKVNNKRVNILIVGTMLYLIAMVYIGFYVTTFLYLMILMYGFSEQKNKIVALKVFLSSFVVDALIYICFWTFLQVPTPVGLLL